MTTRGPDHGKIDDFVTVADREFGLGRYRRERRASVWPVLGYGLGTVLCALAVPLWAADAVTAYHAARYTDAIANAVTAALCLSSTVFWGGLLWRRL